MRVETALAGAIAVVAVVGLVVAVAVPGALAGTADEPGHARLADASVATEEVAPETVTLNVTAALSHYDGTSENLSVRVAVTDLESGLHTTTREVDLATVEGDTELAVPVNVAVPREGGYRIEVLLYQDDQRRDEISREVRGVGDLKPPAAESSVRFHRFDRRVGNDTLPSVQTRVEESGDDQVTLEVSAYLTNERGAEPGGLSLEFVIRQAESGLVADRTRVPIDDVPPQHTVTPGALVSVPDGYNYYVDAILWTDGVIVDSARGVANLDPDESIRVNRSDEDGGLTVSDFEHGGDDAAGDDAARAAADRPTEVDTPGFGTAVALVAIAAAVLLARRRS